jgi:hypothetical protein
MMTNDLSWGSRACRHASPRCVLLHHVVRWLIGLTHQASQKAPKNLPMVKSCNDMSNPLELEFDAPPGNHKNPSQDNHRSRPQTITNTCRTSTTRAVYVAETTKSNKNSRSKSTPQVPLNAKQWSIHLNHSISLKNRNRMQGDEWGEVWGRWLNSRCSQVCQNVKYQALEPANTYI